MIKAFIFDLDGTLFDSAQANIAAYSQAFKEMGIEFNEDEYKRLFGHRFNEMMAALAPDTSEETRNNIKLLKVNYYKQSLDLVTPNYGLLNLLQSVQSTHLTALVTTANKTNVDNLLEHFNISPSIFNLIITAQDVTNSKPHPECYALAAQSLHVDPGACIVFEDSDIGVQAATAAGTQVIRVKI